MGMKTHNIVVLGAGYAGVMAANQLAAGHNVTLINARPYFVERIRLHQFVVGGHPAQVPLAEVLNPDVQVIVAQAQRIDAGARHILLDNAPAVAYDYLVYAVGSRAELPTLPGSEFAYSLADWESAQRLRDALKCAPQTVTVVGGGLTGIETAAELAEARPESHVSLVTASVVAPGFSPRGRRAVLRALTRLGVSVYENSRVRRIEQTKVVTDRETVPSDVTIVATGLRAGSLAAESGLTTDMLGRLVTDHALRSSDPRIIAAGDAAGPPADVAHHIRMSCAAALPLGALAARTVNDLAAGNEPGPVSSGFVIQCLSLGRRRGVVQHVAPDDQPRDLAIAGRTGAFVKEQICRGTLRWLAREIQKPGSYKWPEGPRATAEISRKVHAG
ncbi:FAD-dependent pyridine nucleotide-disulfide oxidoreductase [Hoyosella subflava DQS3-9A1]|uniref:FAD-dependent pyridine nucleotide-disulfide oxidoreductase n=2 Tax=Hoyosella TaxID=697025 RepID=F6EI51_HOYSD|nr:FAD-dependent pyridine nucleotide-disulfide oxidoreductase [Hoyosella subflava DQS3-9A1]